MTEHTVEELDPEADDVEITGEIAELPTPRAVSTRYGQKRIVTVVFEDETGDVDLTLWEEEIDEIEEGAQVQIEGAYVREWADGVQLNISRDGDIERVDE
ncbi:MAG: OB-fold nucleic acid binding domain family protein [Candidatus Nanosalina sp. J07AB43]|jgi:OB-fold nucleic acid binding domain.|nr:MAG: OB-fold nucleic acid binding domain family protein [Candidatus Nanosalina sp. J07AB43]